MIDEEETRTNIIWLVVGDRGNGKTDFLKNLINLSAFDKKLVVDIMDSAVWRNMKSWNHPDLENQIIPICPPSMLDKHRKGLYRTFSEDVKEMERLIQKNVSNSLVVVEDASRYYQGLLSESQKNYLLNSKQKNIDLILVFHYLTDISPRLLKMANYITLFYTGEKTYKKDRFFYPGFDAAFEMINKNWDFVKNRYVNITLKLK
jgi:hypothetical protein